MPMQHMKAPESAQCYASTLYENPQSARCHANATHEGSQMSSVPCQRNTWRFPNELSAMPAQYMKAPEQARCHVSAIHEGSRTSSETQKLLVQAIEETVRNVKFFLKANSVIEEQKSTFDSQVRAVDQTAYPLQTSVASLATDWWMEPWPPALLSLQGLKYVCIWVCACMW